jgi:patatin-like phospholipase/acyl hydrolase
MHRPQFKILSIDGGGIRGVIPCIILRFIEGQLGRSISSTFDLIAGTSTGGIIALGLGKADAAGQNAFSAQDMIDLFVEHGSTIFSRRRQDFLGWVSTFNKTTGELFKKPYDSVNIEFILKKYFANNRLSDLLADVLITTYEIKRGTPFYFASRLAKANKKENLLLREIARSTSAAPTFFEPSLVRYDKRYNLAFVDGGVFANNPSILGYSEGKELWKRRIDKGFEPEVLADDKDFPFYMLSIGTGYYLNKIPIEKAKGWRNKDWIEPLLSDVFMRSVAESTHFTMRHLLPFYSDGTPRYERLDFEIPKENSLMDDASPKNVEKLCKLAERFVERNKERLLAICDYLQ